MDRDERDYKPYTIKWMGDEGEVENRLIDGCGWDSIVEMADKEAKGRSVEIWTRPPYDEKRDSPLHEHMLYSRLSLKAQTELDAITSEMVDEAKSMVEDFVDNPSELSGELDFKNKKAYGDGIRIHQNSPQLDEDENAWKSTGDMLDEMDEDKK